MLETCQQQSETITKIVDNLNNVLALEKYINDKHMQSGQSYKQKIFEIPLEV